MLLQEWAEGQHFAAWDRVIEREKAKASPEVIWYHRGRDAAFLHLLALVAKYPHLNVEFDEDA